MEQVKVRIEGITPLLMHRFGQDTDNVPKSKKKGQKQITDDYKSYLYVDHEGKLVQPAEHIMGAMKDAGAKFQIPSQRKMTYKKIIGSGAVQVVPDLIPHEVQSWTVDSRPVVVNRGRIIRQRPRLDRWALSFTLLYDEEEISKATLKEILEVAGKTVGIGDFRPAKGGMFGKFMVTQFDEVK
ncbi:MAG: hypothetical protein ACUVWN_04590 [bacterium]